MYVDSDSVVDMANNCDGREEEDNDDDDDDRGNDDDVDRGIIDECNSTPAEVTSSSLSNHDRALDSNCDIVGIDGEIRMVVPS